MHALFTLRVWASIGVLLLAAGGNRAQAIRVMAECRAALAAASASPSAETERVFRQVLTP